MIEMISNCREYLKGNVRSSKIVKKFAFDIMYLEVKDIKYTKSLGLDVSKLFLLLF